MQEIPPLRFTLSIAGTAVKAGSLHLELLFDLLGHKNGERIDLVESILAGAA